MTFFIALFILDMQFLWKYIDELVGKGLEWHLIAQLMYYASATFVPLALPLAVLLSSLMTFGNLGEHYELVSMKASGISLRRIMMPLIIFSICLSIAAFYFSNNILPVAQLKFQNRLYDIRHKKLTFNIKEGVFYKDLDGYVIRVGKKDKDDVHIHDVLIYNHTKRLGNIDVTVAKWGKMESTSDGQYIFFTLYDGYSYTENVEVSNYKKNRPDDRTKFDEQVIRFDLSSFEMNQTDEDLFKHHYLMLNLSQLSHTIDSLNTKLDDTKTSFKENLNVYNRLEEIAILTEAGALSQLPKVDSGFQILGRNSLEKVKTNALSGVQFKQRNIENSLRDWEKKEEKIRKHIVVYYEKFTLSFACLVLFFVGAPLGAIIRKGGLGLPVVFSVIFFIIFHIISIMGKKYVLAGAMHPILGMWLASICMLPLGIFLTFKATTDAPLLDADVWRKNFKTIIGRFSKSKNREEEY